MKKAIIVLALALLVTTGCTIKFGSKQPPAIAGVFKSFDKGTNWQDKNLFLYSGGTGSIAGINITSINFDPEDNRAIYITTDTSGMFYSYDGGDSWRKADQIGDGLIQSVAIDPKNKCVIYATYANTILKSTDCNRTWAEVYIDTRKDKAITSLAVDPIDNLVVYAGNNVGDVFKSVDGGGNWRTIYRLNNQVMKILIDPNDNRTIYIPTKSAGIFKTISAGADWFSVSDGLNPYSGAKEYRNLIFDLSSPNSLLLASKYGLIKTDDGGQNWVALSLITPPTSVDISAVTINPKNNQEIYYATTSTFYKTEDGGKNWITRRLPSTAIASYLVNDPVDPSVIYLGMTNPSK